MFYAPRIVIAEIIKAQAVFLRIDQLYQKVLHTQIHGCVQIAFKHRVLYALPVVDALLRHLPQPLPSGSSLSIDIIRA